MFKVRLGFIPALLNISLAFFFLVPGLEAVAKPKAYALVIGITTYNDSIYNNLQYPASDALRFAEYLQQSRGHTLKPEQIRVLLNEEATLASVIRSMKWLQTVCKAKDTAFIFFAGHGALETLAFDNEGYLLAYNTPRYHYKGLAIPVKDVNALANTLSTKNKAKVVLVTDACHSGKIAGNFLKHKPLVAEALSNVLNNEVRLAACQPNELAKEGSVWGGGVFTFHLLNGLYGNADANADGNIPYNELAAYISNAVANDKELKAQRLSQSPALDGPPDFLLGLSVPSKMAVTNASDQTTISDDLLQLFKPAGLSLVQYFFTMAEYYPFEGVVGSGSFADAKQSRWSSLFVENYVRYYDSACAFPYCVNVPWNDGFGGTGIHDTVINDNDITLNRDSIQMLQQQLAKDENVQRQFMEQWIDWVYSRGIAMIDAYLTGDIDELERRQYYAIGTRTYNELIDAQRMLLKYMGKKHPLYNTMLLHHNYLSGMVCRLNMAFTAKTDSLLQKAFVYQYFASAIDNKTGYVNNELGNLHLFKGNTDSAAYYFKLAADLAPAWAVPWSNLIRYNVAIDNMPKAYEAAAIADSLQPQLSFVYTNLGLAYEKEEKWLEATDAYYEAIALNNVHYLPYDRLARIWLENGDYKKADRLFFESETRRQDFAVNEDYFQIGVELGGYPRAPGIAMMKAQPEGCDTIFEGSKRMALQYFNAAYRQYDAPIKQRIEWYEKAAQLDSALPFVHHQLGRLYLEINEPQKAIQSFQNAIRQYGSRDWVVQYVVKRYFPDEEYYYSCLYAYYDYLYYESVEDQYLLASAYEKAAEYERAIAVYASLIAVEKQKDSLQASLNSIQPFPVGMEAGPAWADSRSVLLELFEVTPQVTYLKLLALYEKLQRFRDAERVVLDQLAFQQKCGWIRDTTIYDLKTRGVRNTGLFIFNYYWLMANRHPEAVAYNFYRRMITLFPREPYWYEQGGMQLYKRMKLAYDNIGPETFITFTESLDRFAYPWQTSDHPQEYDSTSIAVPGLNEDVVVHFTVFNPLTTAHQWLDSAWRLFKNDNPNLPTSVALADINAWKGNYRESFTWYRKALSQNADAVDVRLRYNLLLSYYNHRKDALQQQEKLQAKNQLPQSELPPMIMNLQLSRQWLKAENTLSKYIASDSLAQWQKIWWHSQITFLKGDTMQAINQLQAILESRMDSAATEQAMALYPEEENVAAYCYYALARWQMLCGDTGSALQNLDRAVSIGYRAGYILEYDPVWNKVNKTSKWKQITEKIQPWVYTANTDHDGKNVLGFIGLQQITIPTHFKTENNWQY